MPAQRWELHEGPPSSRGPQSSRGPPSSRSSSMAVAPRNRDTSPFATTNSNLGGNWERLETPNRNALMSPQVTSRSERPRSVDSQRRSSQSMRGPGPSLKDGFRDRSAERSEQWERASLDSSISSAEKTKGTKRADTPMPRRLHFAQKKSPYQWTGNHDGAPPNCKCPVCAPMNIAASRVAGLHSGTINLTLSDKLNLAEKPELGEVAPPKPELTAGSKRREAEVGELIENQATGNLTKQGSTGKGWVGGDLIAARKTVVGDHLVLAGNEPRPEDADKFEFHLQFKDFKRKKKGYFSRPSHTGLSMQGEKWKERSHLQDLDQRCQAEKDIGWNPEPRGAERESYLVSALQDQCASYTPQSARSRSSSVHLSHAQLQNSSSERELPLSEASSSQRRGRRQPKEYIVPQVNVNGHKLEEVPQDHLYQDHRGPTNEHFHMSKKNAAIRPSLFQNGVGLIEQDACDQAKKGYINEADLVCDSYRFEEGMPWMTSRSQVGFGERDYIAKRRLRKWGEFSHGPSLRYVALEERAKPLYRYHRAVSAPPEVSGERHASSLLGSTPILGRDRGRCKDTWESWRPAKRGCHPQGQNSSREVADAVRNAEVHNYEKNFKKRTASDPKFAKLCKETSQMHREGIQMKKSLRQKWQSTSIGALLQPDSRS